MRSLKVPDAGVLHAKLTASESTHACYGRMHRAGCPLSGASVSRADDGHWRKAATNFVPCYPDQCEHVSERRSLRDREQTKLATKDGQRRPALSKNESLERSRNVIRSISLRNFWIEWDGPEFPPSPACSSPITSPSAIPANNVSIYN